MAGRKHRHYAGSTSEHIAALRALLKEMEQQDRWLKSMTGGTASTAPQMAAPAETGHAQTGQKRHARHTGSSTSDPTATQAMQDRAAHKRRRLHRDIAFLFEKAAEIYDRTILTEQKPKHSDELGEHGPVDETSGISAYRREREAPAPPASAPIGRPDLQAALDAQHRRLARGEGWGDA